MKSRSLLWGLVIVACLAVPLARAEDTAPGWSHVELPTYPALLRNLKIGGRVKLVLTLAPDGKVKQTTVRGGNPMLAELSCIAARKWVHAGAVPDNKVEVDLVFDPASGVAVGAQ
ncbi:MAG TPA: energy transducer TonB [Terriglobales bacterium]|nr:energy transducer TonB [Terriglobales bacterium]